MATSNRVRVVVALPFVPGDPFGARFQDPDDVAPGDEYQGPPPTFGERIMRVLSRGPGDAITVSDLGQPRVQIVVLVRGNGTVVGTWRPSGTVPSADLDDAQAAVDALLSSGNVEVARQATLVALLFRDGPDRRSDWAAAVAILQTAVQPPELLAALDTVKVLLLAELSA